MTYVVLRRSIGNEDAFARAVEMFASEKRQYAEHLIKVARGEADHYPPPVAPPAVIAAVNPTTMVPDYQIVDALPVERGDLLALNVRKDELRHQVAVMEESAVTALLPRGKWRLSALQHAAASEKPEDARTASDREIIAAHASRLGRLREIHMHHARLEAEIEDLTFDTVNDWTPHAM